MKCISANIIVLIVLFFMQSCIRDDGSDCKTSALRLSFRYTLNNQHSDLFASEVYRVTVYVFDADGKYVGSYSESGDKLAGNYSMVIPLPKGNYQVVAFCDNLNTFTAGWMDGGTNTFNNQFQPGITTVTDFRIGLNSTEGTEGYLIPQAVPGDLYAGHVDNALSTDDASCITVVDLMKNTKNVEVKVSYTDLVTRSVTVPEVYITATNGRYKNDNSIDTSHRMLKYIPHNTSVTDNTAESDLRTMRLVIGHDPVLVVKNPATSQYILNRDLTELILSNPKYTSQEDIDREDTFVFDINVSQSGNNIVISVSINGWEINAINPVND
ncbi:FimB/Mfa2 family fimbrial subunit [Bacteroides sp.]